MSTLGAPERLQLLVEHHRACSSEMRDRVRARNRMFLFAVLVLAGITLRSWDAASGERVLALVLDRIIGAHADIDRAVLSALLWASFLFITARYFQTNVHLDRQYDHLARVEEEIATLFGNDLLARESTGYLKNYPLFSDWMHLLYTWLFPIALLSVAIWSIVVEVRLGELGAATLVPVTVGAIAAITTVLYVYTSKIEPWRRQRREGQPSQADAPPRSPGKPPTAPAPRAKR